jgi:hypothetical protein
MHHRKQFGARVTMGWRSLFGTAIVLDGLAFCRLGTVFDDWISLCCL